MECKAYGIPLPPLKERFDRFDEGVEAIVSLLLSQTVSTTYSGTVRAAHRRSGASRSRYSARTRRSPSAATDGKTRTLRTAARFASEVERDDPGSSPQYWLELKGVLADHCAAIGRDFSEITCSVNCSAASGDGNLDLDAGLVATIAQWRDAGADLADHRPAAARQAGLPQADSRGARVARLRPLPDGRPADARAGRPAACAAPGARAGRGWRPPSQAARRVRRACPRPLPSRRRDAPRACGCRR
jgi:hypothetical protein